MGRQLGKAQDYNKVSVSLLEHYFQSVYESSKKKKKFALTFFDMFLGTYVPETDRYFICIIIFIFTP